MSNFRDTSTIDITVGFGLIKINVSFGIKERLGFDFRKANKN